VVITKANPVGKIKGNTIYKVAATELLPLRERALNDADENRYRVLVQDFIKTSPLFFSYTFDVTSSFQRQAAADLSLPLWQRADDRFFWNRFIQSDLIDHRLGKGRAIGQGRSDPAIDPYILPVMFGMLEIRNTSIKGTPLVFVLTSRRSRFRAGTRYFSRGIDEAGNVSNFNETEQTIILNDSASKGPVSYTGDGGVQYDQLKKVTGQDAQTLSYVQTRGSVPVYWAEVNNLHYIPDLQIRGVDSALVSAQKHFDQQIDIYGDQWLVNLVNQKGREKRVKEAYEQMVRNLLASPTTHKESDYRSSERTNIIESSSNSGNRFNKVHYVYFDFHNETKGLKWHRAQILLNQLEEPLRVHGYFRSVDMPGETGAVEVRGRQSAVVRTNCMDCLDRTNVVQSMLGRFMLTRMLIDLGVMREGEEVSQDRTFEHLFRNTWADNADVVSKAYSGTGALKTDFTRTGERTKKGAFNDFTNSSTRYIKNNFLDGPRQDAFDVFLGNYKPNTSQIGRASIFADKRPIPIQGVPYILMASLILMLVGSFARRDLQASVWPLRLAMMISFAIAVGCLYFMWTFGMLYVSFLTFFSPSHN
jgi:hypothetical protein